MARNSSTSHMYTCIRESKSECLLHTCMWFCACLGPRGECAHVLRNVEMSHTHRCSITYIPQAYAGPNKKTHAAHDWIQILWMHTYTDTGICAHRALYIHGQGIRCQAMHVSWQACMDRWSGKLLHDNNMKYTWETRNFSCRSSSNVFRLPTWACCIHALTFCGSLSPIEIDESETPAQTCLSVCRHGHTRNLCNSLVAEELHEVVTRCVCWDVCDTQSSCLGLNHRLACCNNAYGG